jgi:hypothetical protein
LYIHFDVAGAERMRLQEYELHVGSGLGAGNANMQSGITIWQGGYDTEVLAFKSSDVAHAWTAITETDTYAYMAKASAAYGGLAILGIAEDDASASSSMIFYNPLYCGA